MNVNTVEERVCVIGLGKIGLPLAVQYATKGCQVIGCDIRPGLVESINRGVAPEGDEEGLPHRLAEAVSRGLLSATTDAADAVRRSRVIVIVVPVDVDEHNLPNFSAIDAVTAILAENLSQRTLIVLETTVPVGTTRRRIAAALGEAGLIAGRDYLLAYSPERVFAGRIFNDLARYPKVIGGVDEQSAQAAHSFYARVLDAPVLLLESAEAAEFTKLAESVYRDVNIALANELAIYATRFNVNVYQSIVAANSQPFSNIHQPGLGVGGHCIPVYPYFLIGQDDDSLIAQARRINDGMSSYAASLLDKALDGLLRKTILILGLAYRPNVKEASHSSTVLLARELERAGATVLVHDPLFNTNEIEALGLKPVSIDAAQKVDALVLQSLHDVYRDLDLSLFTGCRALLDGRNAMSKAHVEAAGISYLAIGG